MPGNGNSFNFSSIISKIVTPIVVAAVPTALYKFLGAPLIALFSVFALSIYFILVNIWRENVSNLVRMIGGSIIVILILLSIVLTRREIQITIDILKPSDKVVVKSGEDGEIICKVSGESSNIFARRGSFRVWLFSRLHNSRTWSRHKDRVLVNEYGRWESEISVNPNGSYMNAQDRLEIVAIVVPGTTKLRSLDNIASFETMPNKTVMSDIVEATIKRITSDVEIEQVLFRQKTKSPLDFDVIIKNDKNRRILLTRVILSFNEARLQTSEAVSDIAGEFLLKVGETKSRTIETVRNASGPKNRRFSQQGNRFGVNLKLAERIPANGEIILPIKFDWSKTNLSKPDLESLTLRFVYSHGTLTNPLTENILSARGYEEGQIISAKYGSEKHFNDVTKRVGDLDKHDELNGLQVSNSVFGQDPDLNVRKKLTIVYWGDGKKRAVYHEGEEIVFPP